MLGAAIVLATAMAPVTMPPNQARRLISEYPAWAVREERSSAAVLEAIVEPDGTMRACRIIAFVGSERLVNEECSRLKRRKLRPATGPDGRPLLGLYRTEIVRFVSGTSDEIRTVRQWAAPANLTLPMPQTSAKSAGQQIDVYLALLVSPDGSMTACEGTERNKRGKVAPGLVDAACIEAAKLGWTPLISADGRPTDYVAMATVRFAVNSGA